jgi:hypothetical protein
LREAVVAALKAGKNNKATDPTGGGMGGGVKRRKLSCQVAGTGRLLMDAIAPPTSIFNPCYTTINHLDNRWKEKNAPGEENLEEDA